MYLVFIVVASGHETPILRTLPQAIAKYAAAQLAPAAAPAPVLRAAPVAAERGPLAALSSACRFPAGGEDPEIFWTALAAWPRLADVAGTSKLERFDTLIYLSNLWITKGVPQHME